MKPITADDLLATLIACAGEPEATPPASDLGTAVLGDLGYDSLALIEAIAELENRFALLIPDSVLDGVRTFDELAGRINTLARAAA